jgi:beta-phosphoglucomutase-like phosphatase (HAD superfamily)
MKLPVTIDPRYHDAVIFDLDGVVTDTASIHAAAWTTLFAATVLHRTGDPPRPNCAWSAVAQIARETGVYVPIPWPPSASQRHRT